MAQKPREERKKKVIEVLNKARAMELQAISQYMNQHYNLDDMDYGDLAAQGQADRHRRDAPCRDVRRAHQGAGRRADHASRRPR